jgi:hypothetical protein
MNNHTFRGVGKSTFTKEALERLKDDLGRFYIKVGVYEIHGETYHELRPTGWMNAGESVNWRAMEEWTRENFGPIPQDGVWTPGARWYANNASFYFRNIEDRDWFLLRWTY